MVARYEIVTDKRAMTITVGPRVYDRPRLYRMQERDASLKAEICGEAPWHEGPKAAYQFYASMLGPKFNRRFQAANYWLWVGWRMTERTANMLRRDGRHWRLYHEGLVFRAHSVLPYINEAERDGLFHLIPVIVAFAKSPQEIRRQIGRGAWRRVANNSVSRNRLLLNAHERMRLDNGEADAAMFIRLLDFPSGVMRAVFGATDEEVIAARITPRKRPVDFQQTAHLVRDTMRMTGEAFNPAWGLARMLREHENASRNIMRRRFSDKRFTADWTFEGDGFTATLLTSQLDIATEGETQHHCVGSYAKMAERGDYIVFRIEGKERATAGLTPSGRVDQVYGACNSRVSEECRAFVFQCAEEYRSVRIGNSRRIAA